MAIIEMQKEEANNFMRNKWIFWIILKLFAKKKNLLANRHQREINQTGGGFFYFILPALGQLAKVLIGDQNE